MLTEAKIGKLRPRAARYAVGDGHGLEFIVLASGRRSWIFRYRLAGRSRSVKIGEWPKMSLAQARKAVRMARVSVSMGRDPAAERGSRRPVSVEEFGARWMREVVIRIRKNSRPVERILERRVYPVLGKAPVAQVSVGQIRDLVFGVRDEGKPEAAATLRHLLKRLFDYAEACEASPSNPVRALPLKFVARHRSRSRALSERELRIFLERLADPRLKHLGWALELMLLTLCRKSELRLARWEHIDFVKREWEIPAENSKTGVPHIVYLSARACELLRHLQSAAGRAAFVLPKRDSVTEPIDPATINKAVRRVKWGISAFTPHDLRRTGSTILNEQGYRADVVEKALNHAKQGVRGVYNRAEHREERKRMLDEWATYLDRLKGNSSSC